MALNTRVIFKFYFLTLKNCSVFENATADYSKNHSMENLTMASNESGVPCMQGIKLFSFGMKRDLIGILYLKNHIIYEK